MIGVFRHLFMVSALAVLGLGLPGSSQAQTTIPASAVAPWPVLTRVDALRFSSRVGLTTVWGDYWERSEDPTGVTYVEQTQELSNTANGNYAVYDVDLGSGVEALMLRVALASGSNRVDVRLGSTSGTLVGSCTVNSTGSSTTYRTVACPLNASLARGRQSLLIQFPGTASTMRFNWFAFWARNTTQRIDQLQKIQPDRINRAAPVIALAGTAARRRDMLPSSSTALARSYGLWEPTKDGDCPKWMHDTYWIRGEDGKAYPTWHPPVDFNPDTNTYCTYGHDHGDDPRGSEVFSIAGWPAFGFVNEQQAAHNPSAPRHEDHVGHKVYVANNWVLYNANNSSTTKSCDLVVKIHMGTHSPDALVNTAHEMFLAGQCDGLEPFNLKHLALFGAPGFFKEPETELCNQTINPGIAPHPANQPTGGVHRAIPTAACYLRGTTTQQNNLVLERTKEFWLTSFAGGSFYFDIGTPSRYYDPNSSTKIGRTVGLCSQSSHPLARTLYCQEALAAGSSVAWDDVRSPFRGSVTVNTHFSGVSFPNASSTTIYTDAYGGNARTSPSHSQGITFKQTVPTRGFTYKVDGGASVFPPADYSAGGRNGVRAPN